MYAYIYIYICRQRPVPHGHARPVVVSMHLVRAPISSLTHVHRGTGLRARPTDLLTHVATDVLSMEPVVVSTQLARVPISWLTDVHQGTGLRARPTDLLTHVATDVLSTDRHARPVVVRRGHLRRGASLPRREA